MRHSAKFITLLGGNAIDRSQLKRSSSFGQSRSSSTQRRSMVHGRRGQIYAVALQVDG
jgi:hypothetical protein